MKNDEIRAANRKALPKFLLFTLVCAVIGGIAGYCAARYLCPARSHSAPFWFEGSHGIRLLLMPGESA